jgi:ABC-2 type transport system ATP-binding protein
MIIDIFPPDEGEVRFLGHKMGDRIPPGLAEQGAIMRDLLGYLPEERGLYRRGKLSEVLEYLARLHGVPPSEARKRVLEGLEPLGLSPYANRKIIDLSKGMTQRAQFLAASVHRPRLMILDEPFSGLDPVGVQWALGQIRTFHDQGATILLSAHQMAMVEKACDRVVMVNQGKRVLYGSLDEIRAAHARDHVTVSTAAALDELVPDLRPRRSGSGRWEISLEGLGSQALLATLVERNVPVSGFVVAHPTLEEIFLEVVRRDEAAA